MNQACDYFLAGATFPQHQDGNIYARDQRCLRANLAHGRTGGHEEHFVSKLFDLAGKILLILAQTLVNDGVQFRFLEGLGQVIVCPQTDGLHHFAGIADARKHDYFHARHELPQLLESLQSVDSGHEQVQQHQVGPQPFLHSLQRFFAGRSGFDLVLIHL